MDLIKCPACGHKFELSDSIAGPLVAEAKRTAEMVADQRVEAARHAIEASATAKAQKEQAAVVEAIKREAKDAADSERAMSAKLAIAQAAQAEAARKTRELDDARRELELTVENRVGEQVATARIIARQAAEETVGAKLREKELQLESMARTVEDLKRKAEQGSTQIQGEAQELALESALRERFPTDEVIPVGKGIQGADCLLVLQDDAGRILFESKQTKAWSAGWVQKLKDDGRTAKADVLIIASTVLPKDFKESFGYFDGVWAVLPSHAVPLTAALRMSLFEVAAARKAGENVESKAGLVYKYLTGQQFRNRVSAIVEAFSSMHEDLEVERRAITKHWAKRQSQIERAMQGTTGMYGDLMAIAGKSLKEIEGLSLTALESPK